MQLFLKIEWAHLQFVQNWNQGSIYWKIPPPTPHPPGGGGGNKYGLMGKKYHENNASADKKGEKERKAQGKE